MKTTRALRTFMASHAGRATSLSIVMFIGITGATLLCLQCPRSPEASGAATYSAGACTSEPQLSLGRSETIPVSRTLSLTMPKGKAESIGLETAPVRRGNWPERLRVTGRLELNESRIADVSSLVEGVVREVPVEMGQTVSRGDVLAYVDSREVGVAKLQLVKSQLELTSAERTSKWCEAIHENTVALLDCLENGQTLDDIATAFRDRPVGTYREKLVSALARLNRARADFDRIRGLGESAIIPQKEVVRSRAELEAAEATYRALVEQTKFDAEQRAMDARQQLQAAAAAVAISRSHLLILGYSEEDIDLMDPLAEAGRVAYYPIRSPLTGTVIAKNAPLSKHVDDEADLFRVADFSTVWLRADVFEKDLDATLGLKGKTVTFQTNGYPDRQFTADIFSLGDLIDDQTRAARLLAIADNSLRLLRPGMFVEVELTPRDDANVLQLPASAIQRHAGATFVFVCDGANGFARRDVKTGRSTSEVVEIIAGLADGELVVIKRGFALKSEMLSDLMAEG